MTKHVKKDGVTPQPGETAQPLPPEVVQSPLDQINYAAPKTVGPQSAGGASPQNVDLLRPAAILPPVSEGDLKKLIIKSGLTYEGSTDMLSSIVEKVPAWRSGVFAKLIEEANAEAIGWITYGFSGEEGTFCSYWLSIQERRYDPKAEMERLLPPRTGGPAGKGKTGDGFSFSVDHAGQALIGDLETGHPKLKADHGVLGPFQKRFTDGGLWVNRERGGVIMNLAISHVGELRAIGLGPDETIRLAIGILADCGLRDYIEATGATLHFEEPSASATVKLVKRGLTPGGNEIPKWDEEHPGCVVHEGEYCYTSFRATSGSLREKIHFGSAQVLIRESGQGFQVFNNVQGQGSMGVFVDADIPTLCDGDNRHVTGDPDNLGTQGLMFVRATARGRGIPPVLKEIYKVVNSDAFNSYLEGGNR